MHENLYWQNRYVNLQTSNRTLLNLTPVQWHNTSLNVNMQFQANLQGQYNQLNNLPSFFEFI